MSEQPLLSNVVNTVADLQSRIAELEKAIDLAVDTIKATQRLYQIPETHILMNACRELERVNPL